MMNGFVHGVALVFCLVEMYAQESEFFTDARPYEWRILPDVLEFFIYSIKKYLDFANSAEYISFYDSIVGRSIYGAAKQVVAAHLECQS